MSKVLMPALFLILVAVAVYSLCLGEGVKEGLSFYLNPDFSHITFSSVLAAMGQAFFSLSLGMGTVIAYGSYTGKEINMVKSTGMICVFDTFVALLSGLAIFPAVAHFDPSLLGSAAGAGLMFGILLMIEKWVPGLQKLPNVLCHGYVLLPICLSFVLFNAESLSQAASDMGGMFGLAGVPLVNGESLYYLRSCAPLFIMGCVGATPVVRDTARRIGEKPWGAVLEVLMMAALLIVCSAYLVDGSFSPFLYFRF
jgi:hypothetical protein